MLFFIFYVPTTALYEVVTQWCWHTALPVVTSHLGLSGHSVGDVALLALAVSMLSVCIGLWRATRALSAWVRRTSVGPGPQESLIVGEYDIVVAAAGLVVGSHIHRPPGPGWPAQDSIGPGDRWVQLIPRSRADAQLGSALSYTS